MSEDKFTPGPWFVENIMCGGPRVVHGEIDKETGFRDDVTTASTEEGQANAALMASAPTLHAENKRLTEDNLKLIDTCEAYFVEVERLKSIVRHQTTILKKIYSARHDFSESDDSVLYDAIKLGEGV